jgi:uncharacterized protein
MPIFLWRDKHSELLLLGSLHFLPSSAHPFAEEFERAYEAASVLVFESLIDQEKNHALGWLPGKASLSDVLDEELLLTTETAAENLEVPFDNLKQLRPWAVAFDLLPHQMKLYGATADLGVDKHFFDRARAEQRRIDALEHTDYVPKRLNACGRDVQIEYLRQFLTENARGAESFYVLLNAWRNGDLDAVERVGAENLGPFPGLIDLLLAQRNRNWLPRLQQLRKAQSPTLVIVGCLHLVGPGNLRELLEQKGAKFEQM